MLAFCHLRRPTSRSRRFTSREAHLLPPLSVFSVFSLVRPGSGAVRSHCIYGTAETISSVVLIVTEQGQGRLKPAGMTPPPSFMTEDEDVFMETPPAAFSPNHSSWMDSDLQTAVALSMDELDSLDQSDGPEGNDEGHSDSQPCHGASSAVHPDAEKPKASASTQKALEKELMMHQEAVQYALDKRIELPLLNFADADTLVIIDPPPVTRKGGRGEDTGLVVMDNTPHRMHSDRLKATGSAFFIDALGPTKQYRLVRRRGLLPLPPGIKFVIDLTPPEEGDLAVELTAELSCSKGVRQYFLAELRFEIPRRIVGGHDDIEERNIINSAGNSLFAPEGQGASVLMDYTAIRHRLAIERVLHIIEGLDPRIDSAPKMWSVFCVAKFLNCTSVVENYILSWIYDGLNVRFIEILPEVTLKIAEGLRNQMLCRDAFSVLVAEEALASVGRDVPGRLWKSRARRRREELDLDSFVTRVEYASKAFAERVNATFTELAEANWITEVAEYRKIVSFLNHRLDGYHTVIHTLTASLRSFVRARIFRALSVLTSVSGDLDGSTLAQHRKGGALFPYLSHAKVYGGIGRKEALLTRDYWGQLANWDIFSRNFAPGGDSFVPVCEFEDNFQPTTWEEVMNETKRFNRLVIGMVAKFNTGLGAPCLLGDLEDTSFSCWPPCAGSPGAPHSGSDQAGTFSSNCLPIRPKHGQTGTPLGVLNSEGAKDLPILPKTNVQCLPFNAGPSKSSPIQMKRVSPHPFHPGELSGDTAGFQDIARYWLSPRPDSSEFSKKADTLLDHVPDDSEHAEYQHEGVHYPFNIINFLKECGDRLYDLSRRMTKGNVNFDVLVTDTLLSLDENEWKYLPLYAGGNDDGSGGVFDQPIPLAVTGPIGPGPRYHIGLGSSAASSEFDMIDAKSTASSSFNTSTEVEDGYSDHLDRRKVYSDDNGMGGGHGNIKGKWKAREVDDNEKEDAVLVSHHDSDGDGNGDDNDDDFFEVPHGSTSFFIG
ncbi:hypothetical protein GP486_005939 [Trichoglossum hirsutum]|uniref:Uncharacterized protein n=1 Tax=Trichoglossum hirsutum TaxID=265104 RepID=A0A9P8L8A6_9PEZI|nr:hypothetical protein GP486_005939 [Trichoglossum hirsutum]